MLISQKSLEIPIYLRKMKTGKRSEFVRPEETSLQGKLPKKKNLIAHLLDDNETFKIYLESSEKCCIYQNIYPLALSPFDVACMRKCLKMTSSEFFSKYAKASFSRNNDIPRAFLNIEYDSKRKGKACQFLVSENEKTFDARPLGCRLYSVARAVDSQGLPYFVLLKEQGAKESKPVKKYTLESWIKNVSAQKWLSEAERYERIFRKAAERQRDSLSIQEKMNMASMLYTPDAFATDDLFSYYLKKPEYALEAMEFGYSKVKKLLESSLSIDGRKFL